MLYPVNMMLQFEENRNCNINYTIKKAKSLSETVSNSLQKNKNWL